MEDTAVSEWTRQSPSLLAYPTILTLHSIGLGVVVGASVIVSARLLGMGRGVSPRSLLGLFPIIWWAFAVNAGSGLLLFMADATRKSIQPIFWVKLAFIAAAIVTVVLEKRRLATEGDHAPEAGGSRLIAVCSLIFWTGAITAGRFMAYM